VRRKVQSNKESVRFEEGDEEQWDLDDAQDELISEAPNPKTCPSQSFPHNADRKIVLVDSSEPMRRI
jgi:hypothetical protein